MKRIVISGASSMLGLALIERCIQKGTGVVALVRRKSLKRWDIPNSPLVQVLECDMEDFTTTPSISDRGFDVFYHYAWGGTDNRSQSAVGLQESNIGYTLDAVHFARTLGCRRFIGAGSQAEYGRISGAISETMKVNPDSPYGIAKYAAGRLAGALCAQLGIEFIWTRIFGAYGENDRPSTMIMHCIDHLLKGKKPVLTKCEQQWDYLNCKDAAEAFYLLGEKGIPGKTYNIGSGTARPLLEYVHLLRDAIDPSLELGIGEKNYAPQQIMHLCADIDRLRQDTGFSPTIPFTKGIEDTIRWYRRQRSGC